MPKLSTQPNRFYPSIPGITSDAASHEVALRIIRESVETHERRNNNYLKSFVRFEELIDLGIIDSSGEFVLDITTTGGVEEAPEDGTPYARQDASWVSVSSSSLPTGTVNWSALRWVTSSGQWEEYTRATFGSTGLLIYDSSESYYTRIDHETTTAGKGIISTNSGDLLLAPATGITRINTNDYLTWWGTVATQYLSQQHDGTDFNIAGDPNLNTVAINITNVDRLTFENTDAVAWQDIAATEVDLLEFGPDTGDPNWASVIYLAKWEGADAATSYTELAQSDTHNFYGNAQLDTAQFNYGASSLLTDGTSDGVQTNGKSIYQLASTDDATVEGFVRFNTLPGTGTTVQLYNQAQQDVVNFQIEFTNTGGLYYMYARFGFGNFPFGYVGSVSTGVWYHFAAQRRYNGGSPIVDLFWNGSRKAATASSNNPSSVGSSVPITLGAWDNATTQVFTEVLDGWLDDLRITKAAVYGDVSTYTVPTDYPTAALNEIFEVGDPGYVTDIQGSEVWVNGSPINENATHTGEVTGATVLTGDVSLITNRAAVTEVSDSGTDDLLLHDAGDGSFKKTPINLVTDGGYF